MTSMFSRARSFNQPLVDWDVSQVKNMTGMFSMASSFNQNLSAWSVNPNVKICQMFAGDANSWELPKPAFAFCNPDEPFEN